MDNLKLAITAREKTGRQVTEVRDEDLIPGVIYGYETENRNVAVDYNTFAKVHKAGGESTLVELESEGVDPVKVLIKDTQRHPLSDRYTHIDFFKVNPKKKITAVISIVFEGESSAVKTLGGFLMTPNTSVEIEALPQNLPHELVVDISKLSTFDNIVRAGDLELPEGVALVTNETLTIAFIEKPKTAAQMEAEEAEDAAATVGDVSAIKTESEEKKDEAEAKTEAEGEATAEKK